MGILRVLMRCIFPLTSRSADLMLVGVKTMFLTVPGSAVILLHNEKPSLFGNCRFAYQPKYQIPHLRGEVSVILW